MIEFAGHHAKPGSQRGHVPALLPEDTHRRDAVRTQARAIFERQQPDERRLAGAIGAENGRVLALLDGERQPIEYSHSPSYERRVCQFEDWFHAIYRRWVRGSGLVVRLGAGVRQ